MSKFTVEEINFMCVFETQDRTDMIGQIRQVMPHIKDKRYGGAWRAGVR